MRRWIVVDTNIFCYPSFDRLRWNPTNQRALSVGSDCLEFLNRMVEECDTYGLAVDKEGLIVEEYEQQIPRESFGFQVLREMMDQEGKVALFDHRNPAWLNQLQDAHMLDNHDRRFLATALATPEKILVSEDTVFLNNSDFLQSQGGSVYDAERAAGQL